MERTIFALFDDALAALRLASALEREGYERDGMSLLVPDLRGRYARPAANDDGGAAADRTSTGASRVFRPLNVAGVGSSAVTGPLSAVLTEGEAGGTPLVPALKRFGFAEPDATHYLESLRRGQALIAVETAENGVEKAVELMRRLGARAVDDTATTAAALVEAESRPAAAPPEHPPERPAERPAPAAMTASAGQIALDEVKVPVVEEQLEVGKRQVNRGGVRIHSHIVEKPVEQKVSLREERLTVERRPVYRDATESDLADFKEGTIEIHETVEEPVISKRRRVVEEIVIGRQARERTATISETVRRTEVSVEPLVAPDFRAMHDAGPRRGEDFEDYEPAYQYGYALARDERFRNAEWDDVEPHARRAWEEENPGAWEQFKDAVRGAWQKVSGR